MKIIENIGNKEKMKKIFDNLTDNEELEKLQEIVLYAMENYNVKAFKFLRDYFNERVEDLERLGGACKNLEKFLEKK